MGRSARFEFLSGSVPETVGDFVLSSSIGEIESPDSSFVGSNVGKESATMFPSKGVVDGGSDGGNEEEIGGIDWLGPGFEEFLLPDGGCGGEGRPGAGVLVGALLSPLRNIS